MENREIDREVRQKNIYQWYEKKEEATIQLHTTIRSFHSTVPRVIKHTQ